MATTTESSFLEVPNDRSVLSPPDKYRGAVVEVHGRVFLAHASLIHLQDLQLPPAFSLPKTELIARAIELAYDRDFSHIPYVPPRDSPHPPPLTACSVLGRHRNLLGYIEVGALKKKWEAGEVNPVSILPSQTAEAVERECELKQGVSSHP